MHVHRATAKSVYSTVQRIIVLRAIKVTKITYIMNTCASAIINPRRAAPRAIYMHMRICAMAIHNNLHCGIIIISYSDINGHRSTNT